MIDQKELEALKKKHDTRIDEIAQLEMDLIDVKLEEYFEKSKKIYDAQVKYGVLYNVAIQLDELMLP